MTRISKFGGRSFLPLLTLLLLCNACNNKPEPEGFRSGPAIQLASGCTPLSGGPMAMRDWAPQIAGRLNSNHVEAPSATANCATGGGAVTGTNVICWSASQSYDGTAAGDNVCDLRNWARANRPASSAVGTLTIRRWHITGYTYTHAPGEPCEPGSQVSDPDPLKLEATYTPYDCQVTVTYDPAEFSNVAIDVTGPPSDPQQDGDGELEVSMVKEVTDRDGEADGGDDDKVDGIIEVKDPLGNILATGPTEQVAGMPPEYQHFIFEVAGYNAADLTIEITPAP